MIEATWSGGAKTPDIDWRMSASLENVPRGDEDVAEVTSLEGAVREWIALDPLHRASAVLTPERPLLIDGASMETFSGYSIAARVDRLPARDEA